jgi:hypothetical protein
MRIVSLLILLAAFCMPVAAQDSDLERLRPVSPEIKADTPAERSTTDSGKPQDSQEVDPLDIDPLDIDPLDIDPLDIDPLDIDPLDILDSENPMGVVENLVDEISRNMKEIEKLLEGDDTGEQNQSVQQQTLSRIDELITEVQKLTGT